MSRSLEARRLSESEILDIFRFDYAPRLRGEARNNPHLFLVGGQQAAGKSTTQGVVRHALGDGVVSYDGDENIAFHPDHKSLMRANDVEAYRLLSGRTSPLHWMVLEHITRNRYDTVASHPLQRPDWARLWVDEFRKNNYHVSTVYIATHESTSLLGIVDRYQSGREREGFGRWISPDRHDETYRGIPRTAHELESSGYVDSMYVVSRDGDLLYENHLGPDGRMRGRLGARRAIEAERNRPKSPEEIADFEAKLRRVRQNAPGWAQPVIDDAEQRHRDLLARTARERERAEETRRESAAKSDRRSPGPPPPETSGKNGTQRGQNLAETLRQVLRERREKQREAAEACGRNEPARDDRGHFRTGEREDDLDGLSAGR